MEPITTIIAIGILYKFFTKGKPPTDNMDCNSNNQEQEKKESDALDEECVELLLLSNRYVAENIWDMTALAANKKLNKIWPNNSDIESRLIRCEEEVKRQKTNFEYMLTKERLKSNDIREIKEEKINAQYQGESEVEKKWILELINSVQLSAYGMREFNELVESSNAMKRSDNWGEQSLNTNKRIIKINKYYIKAYIRLAECYKRRGEIDNALRTYQNVLDIDSQNSESLLGIKTCRGSLDNEQKNAYLAKEKCEAISYYENITSGLNNEGFKSSRLNELLKEELTKRRIHSLYHFTPTINLNSILEFGLRSRNDSSKIGLTAICTDNNRYDHKLDCISLSLSFPNYSMFYIKRLELNELFVVLELDAKLLYLTQATKYFYESNAAKGLFRSDNLPHDDIEAFRKMFQVTDFRKKINLVESYTTDPQAEILFTSIIPSRFIKKIYIENDYNRAEVLRTLKIKEYESKIEVNHKIFQRRYDYNLSRQEVNDHDDSIIF